MAIRRAVYRWTLAVIGSMFVASTALAAPISLTTLGLGYTQDFDTLASTGTSSSLPTGWEFSESGTNANATYSAGTGSSNTGETYSFGATASTERAFGGLLSGNLIPTIGAAFSNNTGATIASLAIAYTGEQWRVGTLSRSDRIDFQFSTDATSLTTGTYTDLDTLDFSSPTTTGAIGLLDGNAAANRTALSSAISGLNIANGATFWIRWTDFNATGADDGLAVDDFSLTPRGTTISPVPEPGTLVLLGLGLAGLAAVRRRMHLRAASRQPRSAGPFRSPTRPASRMAHDSTV